VGRSGRGGEEKISQPLPGLEPPIIQPEALRYTIDVPVIFAGVVTPICVVSGAQFLTRAGWVDLHNNSYTEPPFRLFRDEGRTFLQVLYMI
jgi:hypothetical protein